MNPLHQFTQDQKTREAVIEFFVDYINQYALDKVFKREDITGIADAKKIITDGFEQLNTTYGLPTAKTQTTSQSR